MTRKVFPGRSQRENVMIIQMLLSNSANVLKYIMFSRIPKSVPLQGT